MNEIAEEEVVKEEPEVNIIAEEEVVGAIKSMCFVVK